MPTSVVHIPILPSKKPPPPRDFSKLLLTPSKHQPLCSTETLDPQRRPRRPRKHQTLAVINPLLSLFLQSTTRPAPKNQSDSALEHPSSTTWKNLPLSTSQEHFQPCHPSNSQPLPCYSASARLRLTRSQLPDPLKHKPSILRPSFVKLSLKHSLLSLFLTLIKAPISSTRKQIFQLLFQAQTSPWMTLLPMQWMSLLQRRNKLFSQIMSIIFPTKLHCPVHPQIYGLILRLLRELLVANHPPAPMISSPCALQKIHLTLHCLAPALCKPNTRSQALETFENRQWQHRHRFDPGIHHPCPSAKT